MRHNARAVRVKCVDLPAPFDVWNDMALFVGQPFKLCENSGNGRDVVAPDDCGPAGGLAQKWFWAGPLQCQAHYTDWSEFDTVHVYHESVIPGGTYEIQTIVDGCGLNIEGNYAAVQSMTQSKWGDVCGPGPGGVCTGLADGSADVAQDVVGLLDKFANINALSKSRTDIEPGDNGVNNGPDFKVNISRDVLFALEAFKGFPYPFEPGDPCAPG